MNNEEFEQFIVDNGKEILRFCRIITCGKETGDELYQDTMLKLLEKRSFLRAHQNAKSYALSVSLMLWKNKKKKHANRNRLISWDSIERMKSEDNLVIPDVSAAQPEESAVKKDETETVVRVVADLPELYRIPIQLYYSADMSVKEIAQMLNLPEGTVKSRMNKAKSLIKKELEALGYDR